jgi:hypothetical protein
MSSCPPQQKKPADGAPLLPTNKPCLTKIRRQKSFIPELGGMLVIYKGNVVLKVALDEGVVRVHPVVGRFDNPQLLNAMARNEELLAQVYFTHKKIADPHTAMARYFEQRGWLARMPGQAPPEKDTGAWAES